MHSQRPDGKYSNETFSLSSQRIYMRWIFSVLHCVVGKSRWLERAKLSSLSCQIASFEAFGACWWGKSWENSLERSATQLKYSTLIFTPRSAFILVNITLQCWCFGHEMWPYLCRDICWMEYQLVQNRVKKEHIANLSFIVICHWRRRARSSVSVFFSVFVVFFFWGSRIINVITLKPALGFVMLWNVEWFLRKK